jgi:DNA-binding MarR family transcriptional regulator
VVDILHYIDKHPGCFEKDAARALDTDQAYISQGTRLLVDHDLVLKERDGKHVRHYLNHDKFKKLFTAIKTFDYGVLN